MLFSNDTLKIRQLRLILPLLLTVFFLSSCAFDPPSESILDIYNYTDDPIYVYYSVDERLQLKPKLELFVSDLSVRINKYGNRLDTICYPDYRIDAHSYIEFHDDGVHSSGKFRPFPESNYINFFFIKETTMRENSWEDIVKNQLYVRKVKYTYEELEKLQYQILYKP